MANGNNNNLPDRISRLEELAHNLWWSWNHFSRNLFRQVNQRLWNTTYHNPIKMLSQLEEGILEKRAADKNFLETYDNVMRVYDQKLKAERKNLDFLKAPIAYFSFEFGLHQSLPIYSGGLGVLSGDTLKEAADMDLPYIGIGFLYHQGYFKQRIPAHGVQEAQFAKIKFDHIPINPVIHEDKELVIRVWVGADQIAVKVWQIKLAKNIVYLLDTDIDENQSWYRGLSARLYGGDFEMRINQEILLAFAGIELLNILNIQPSLFHLNEGHCAFLSLKRMEKFVGEGNSYAEALERVRKTTIFTTHTPVPAGHDRFGFITVQQKLSGMWDRMGISRDEFLKLGMATDHSENFNMTVLAMKTSYYVNGVSKLHTEVTRDMWRHVLEINPKITLVDITNGVHIGTWISGPMRRLFNKYVDENWLDELANLEIWEKLSAIPNDEYWKQRLQTKSQLFSYIRETARKHRERRTMNADQILASGALLDPEVLTIGFARRFATYKRANLIFRDIKRLRKILTNSNQPVQIIFAGKSHPADEPGKRVLQLVYNEAMNADNKGRIAFLENYDMHIGRLLVQGVDVWLNNPIRPHEASGTSGMKAAMNGAPHFSILDGWWAEGADHGNNGWVIGEDRDFSNDTERDNFDANSLYSILENEIVPLFYDRDNKDIPHHWIKVSKEAIKTSIHEFSTRRMMTDYINKMYKPAIKNLE
ncbi:MAG: alpha-glucan family phosphorylase [Candidatus Heimdallarchaeota archaeon]|nr:alpha-glucan family phosphorylase [Candidatus Heimdallarchaeota archaeon]